ncbi:hypothetical protein EYF80_010704 [Liparis tanakae]|uniref:Uncharacterized protein n=1 Tax=Liparis tanakae TaxID=230148 RepID=A0A4Z2IMD8_9TELE|nr:hypothetical protein EYF80_010704 [Liparis tanakae]
MSATVASGASVRKWTGSGFHRPTLMMPGRRQEREINSAETARVLPAALPRAKRRSPLQDVEQSLGLVPKENLRLFAAGSVVTRKQKDNVSRGAVSLHNNTATEEEEG